MEFSTTYILSSDPADQGLGVFIGNRLLDFRNVESCGSHQCIELGVHIAEPSICLGSARYLPIIRRLDIGVCRFQLPIIDARYDIGCLMMLAETDEFQRAVRGPLDGLTGHINPKDIGLSVD